ncbi:MAG: RNA polymerase sigma factor, partial [Pseudonocardiaceae bacterium]
MRVTDEQVAAAQLRLVLDEKLGRQTPELVRRIAATTEVERDEETGASSHTVDVGEVGDGAEGVEFFRGRAAAGPEKKVVDLAHASWLAAALTQLPLATREVVDAVGSGMVPSDVARSMNLSAHAVESHLVRARRHLRRMGAFLDVDVWEPRETDPESHRVAPDVHHTVAVVDELAHDPPTIPAT